MKSTRGHRLPVCANGRTTTSFDRSMFRYNKSINHSKQTKSTCTINPSSIHEPPFLAQAPLRVSRYDRIQLAPFLLFLSLIQKSPIRPRHDNAKCPRHVTSTWFGIVEAFQGLSNNATKQGRSAIGFPIDIASQDTEEGRGTDCERSSRLLEVTVIRRCSVGGDFRVKI